MIKKLTCLIFLVVCLNGAHFEQDEFKKDEWIFRISPYVYMPHVNGSLKSNVLGKKVDIKRTFGDIYHDLDSAFFLQFSAIKDNFIFLADFNYVKLGESEDLKVMNFNVPALATLKYNHSTVLSGYRLLNSYSSPVTMDIMGGIRYWYIKTSINIGPLKDEQSKHWIDPIVAVKLNYDLGRKFSIQGYIDSSIRTAKTDFDYQMYAALNYEAIRNLYISA